MTADHPGVHLTIKGGSHGGDTLIEIDGKPVWVHGLEFRAEAGELHEAVIRFQPGTVDIEADVMAQCLDLDVPCTKCGALREATGL